MRLLVAFFITFGSFCYSALPLTKSINESGYQLFYLLNQPQQNLVLSPFSIDTSLYMVFMGARGTTQNEIGKALSLTLSSKTLPEAYKSLLEPIHSEGKLGYQLTLANAIWIDRSISTLNSFETVVKDDFDSALEQVFFNVPSYTLKRINEWTLKNTDGHIQNFITPKDITAATRLMLTNAVYFKGEWQEPFSAKKTQLLPYNPGGSRPAIKVPMMSQESSCLYFEDTDFQMISLPIKKGDNGNDVGLVILLPSDMGNQSPFELFYEKVTKGNVELEALLAMMKMRKVNLLLPKFKVEVRVDLSESLMLMGMQEAFTPEANFSAINGKRDLHLSKVLHGCYFNVNEHGVVAAASTSAGYDVTTTFDKKPPAEFHANHPFFYMLVDLTDNFILFMGACDIPTIQ